MKCESCNTNKVEVEQPLDEGQNPYRLCLPCQQRLLHNALRPLEFFNLASIHGHDYYLHDDFYDFDTGEATQPDIEIIKTEIFPFPKLDDIKDDLFKLVNFACVQYFTSEDVVELLKLHDKDQLLSFLDHKVKYNRAINYKAYEIAGKVLNSLAENWLRHEWQNRKENELLIFAGPISKCLPFDNAFSILTSAIESSSDKDFTDNSSALLYFQNSKTLDWIEKISNRITNVSTNWGTLAATSEFNWHRAKKWLTYGRPLSLIALDALVFCTTIGDRSNQSYWLIKNPPMLLNSPTSDVIANRIREYLDKDKVPRTKDAVKQVIQNLFVIPSK